MQKLKRWMNEHEIAVIVIAMLLLFLVTYSLMYSLLSRAARDYVECRKTGEKADICLVGDGQ